MKTEVIPVVVGALGTRKKGMVENIKRVSERANVTETQNISMLGSARIVRNMALSPRTRKKLKVSRLTLKKLTLFMDNLCS